MLGLSYSIITMKTMSKKSSGTISVLTNQIEEGNKPRSMFPFPVKGLALNLIATNKFEASLSDCVKELYKVVEKLPESSENYSTDSLTFSLSINGAGKISLVGEVSAGITSGITITLKRKNK